MDKLGSVLCLLCLWWLGSYAQTVKVGYVTDARGTLSTSFDSADFSNTLSKLQNTANFGPSGTVRATLTFTSISTITASALSPFNIFYVGFFLDSTFSAGELDALLNWTTYGGTTLLSCDTANVDQHCVKFGYSVASTATTLFANIIQPSHPYFSGPFGPVGNYSQSNTGGYFSGSGANVLAIHTNGSPTILEKIVGAGRVVFLGSLDLISNFVLSTGSTFSTTNNADKFVGNLFAQFTNIALYVTTGERTTGERTTGERTTREQTTGERTTAEQTTMQTTAERTTSFVTTAERTTSSVTTGERTTGERTTRERTTSERTTGERTTGERTTGERTTGERTTGEKITTGVAPLLSSKSKGNNSLVIAAVVAVLVPIFCLLFLVILILLYRKRLRDKREKKLSGGSIELETKTKTVGQNYVDISGIPDQPSKKSQNSSKREIKPEELNLSEASILGQGNFGTVYHAKYRGTDVAVKELNIASDPKLGDEFLKEAFIMANIPPHPNVVLLLGICYTPISIITEFLPGGDLDSYLKKETVPPKLKYELMADIATGMLHLSFEGVVHRDLAARNVLLTADIRAKISDFGLSRVADPEKGVVYSASNVGPLRWMSPEAIRFKKYSEMSDVWSFAITCIEILTQQRPYHEIADHIEIATRVVADNYTHPIPEGTEPFLTQLLKNCWEYHPLDRPKFKAINAIFVEHGYLRP